MNELKCFFYQVTFKIQNEEMLFLVWSRSSELEHKYPFLPYGMFWKNEKKKYYVYIIYTLQTKLAYLSKRMSQNVFFTKWFSKILKKRYCSWFEIKKANWNTNIHSDFKNFEEILKTISDNYKRNC